MLNSQHLQELESDPFNLEDFIERLAWKALNSKPGNLEKEKSDEFDGSALYEYFNQIIQELEGIQQDATEQCEVLTSKLKEEEKIQMEQLSALQDKNKAIFLKFSDLENRINLVVTKVVHLGDQLQSINIPRSRTVEAQKLMTYFSEFLYTGPIVSVIFSDSSKLPEAADIIHKLYLIVQELPQNKFKEVRERICNKYEEIESNLIEEFIKAYRSGNKKKMKEYALLLSHFKGYNCCIDAFIEESQWDCHNQDIFVKAIPLVEKNFKLIKEIFVNPEHVMAKFVLNIFSGKIQEYVQNCLAEKSKEIYLKTLIDLYTKVLNLSNILSQYIINSDVSFLNKLIQNIFQRYLTTYISVETKFLEEKFFSVLSHFYETKNHQRKMFISGTDNWKRDLQALMANMTLGQHGDLSPNETLISEEVSVNVLQESKLAFKRCQLLSQPAEVATYSIKIYDILTQYLILNHVGYALEVQIQFLSPESKTSPDLIFLDCVYQCNTIMHLLEKQFIDFVLPVILSSPNYNEYLQKKKSIQRDIEEKINEGLNRILNNIIVWIKQLLQSEQKKTDYKSDLAQTSGACNKVCKFLNSIVKKMKSSFDGQNLSTFSLQLGIHFHRAILDYIQQFQYSTAGAMTLLCDLNEYRKIISDLEAPLATELFDLLNHLCKLLVVPLENLQQVCNEEQLANLDKAVIKNFIHLRSDYKMGKTGLHWKTKDLFF